MKNSSVKMIWQTVGLTGIATIAAAAFFASCKKAGAHSSLSLPVAINTTAVSHSQGGLQKNGSPLINPASYCTTLPVNNVQGLHRQAGVIYIIF